MRTRQLCFIMILVLNGCASGQWSTERLEEEAVTGGFAARQFLFRHMPIRAFLRAPTAFTPTSRTLTIYIEGDGHAWSGRGRPSEDPTPRNPVAWQLSVQDESSTVAYLARPCQYGVTTRCDTLWWTTDRYSDLIISALSMAVDALKREAGAEDLQLVGYSGGGAVAVLIAARRTDVSAVLTIAANLDIDGWTDFHGVSRLSGSLSPMAALRSGLPLKQLYVWGDDDEIVPPHLAEAIKGLAERDSRISILILEGQDHACCWRRAVPTLLSRLRR